MKHPVQLAKLPTKTTPDWSELLANPDWVVERKWDGMRALFELSATETKIFSRTGQDLRPQFPELLDLHERVGLACVLDGEIIACSAPGVEDLELLQMRLGDKKARRAAEIPVEVRFFDVLEWQVPWTDLPLDVQGETLDARRQALARLLEGSEFETPELLPAGADIPSHWEGVVAKRLASRYTGKRSSDWLKFKSVERATLRAVSLTEGKGARAGFFGAVVVADANGTVRGQVGSGFKHDDLLAIAHAFDRHAKEGWADEKLPLIEVEYRFLSKTGLMVNTAFKGIRTDKEEADVL